MKNYRKHIAAFAALTGIAGATVSAFANDPSQTPDPYQNSGYQNISYDIKSKFYAGVLGGVGFFTTDQYTVATTTGTASASLNSTAVNFGIFAGYKFNDYFSLELAGNRLGSLDGSGSLGTNSFDYSASIYNLNANLLAMYPVISSYGYTISPYIRGGYGVNFTPYDQTVGGASESGTLIRGAFNVGLGVNVDFRSNISARLEYQYYQVAYDAGENGTDNHGINIFNLAVYYNF